MKLFRPTVMTRGVTAVLTTRAGVSAGLTGDDVDPKVACPQMPPGEGRGGGSSEVSNCCGPFFRRPFPERAAIPGCGDSKEFVIELAGCIDDRRFASKLRLHVGPVLGLGNGG